MLMESIELFDKKYIINDTISLNLSSHKLVNFDSIESIFKLVNLQSLNLSSNKIEKLTDKFSAFKNLSDFRIYSNCLKYDYQSYGDDEEGLGQDLYSFGIINLKDLDISYNKIKYLRFTHLNKLHTLDASDNQLVDIKCYIDNLYKLDVYNNKIESLSYGISTCASLKILYVSNYDSYDKEFNDDGLKELSNLTNLESLLLSSYDIEDISYIVELINLEYLALQSTKIEDISYICELTKLKNLSLRHGQIDKIPDEIGKLTNLIVLDLHDNEIYVIPGSIRELISLKRFDITYNELEYIHPNITYLVLDQFAVDFPGKLRFISGCVMCYYDRIPNKNELSGCFYD